MTGEGIFVKTGLVSVSFRKLPPEAIVRLAVECGLQGIEWGGDVHVPAGDLERARAVGEMTRANGLEVMGYGSYYRLTDAEAGMAQSVVDTAKALGAPLIRVWAGDAGSAEADAAKRDEVRRNARRIAGMAADAGMDVAFEWHGGTLTDTLDSALELLQAVDCSNVGTLWQPPVGMDAENCVREIRAAAGYIRNIHVFSWRGTDRLPLCEDAKKWRACLAEIGKLPGERNLLLEFVRNDDPAQLREDAACLSRWMKGEWER